MARERMQGLTSLFGAVGRREESRKTKITRKGKEYDLMMPIYIYRHLRPVVAFNAAMTDRLPGISTITTVHALGHSGLRWAKPRGLSLGRLDWPVNKFYNVQSTSIRKNVRIRHTELQ